MSGSDSNNQKQFQEYVKLPYKPFAFQEPTEQLNLRLIANIDPDQIYYRGDLDQASSVLKNFVNSSIPEEVDYEMFFKLFRMSQLAIEYYSQEQTQRQQQIDDQYSYYKSLQDQETKLKELKAKHTEKKSDYAEQLKKFNQKIRELKSEAEKVGNYKCIYCSKCYREKDGLDSHVKRRHLDMLNEIQETKDMLKERQDPIVHLKKKQQDEIREQNKIQLERMQQLQKQLEQTKINESKLVEEISKKLQQDFDLKISQVIQLGNEEKKQEKERSAKKQQENQQKEGADVQKELILNQSLIKMNENLENFQKAIQEAQEKLNKQQEEYTKQLDKIADNQEELKKSSLQQSTLMKEQQASNFVGNIVSSKQAPLSMQIRQASRQDSFPVQPTPTADFTRGEPKNSKFFEKPLDEDDSFLNNNSIVEDLQGKSKGYNNSQIKGGLQPNIFHIGDLEDDYDSQDEHIKAFKKHKEEEAIKSQIISQQKSSKGNDSSIVKHPSYIYNESQTQDIINGLDQHNDNTPTNNKKPSNVLSLNAIQENQNFMGSLGTDLSLEDKPKQNNNQKTQQELMKKLQDYDEDDEEQYFKQLKSEANDTPKKENSLSNQMSFGGKHEYLNQDSLQKKSNFGRDQKQLNELQHLTIKEYPSKEDQNISKQNSKEKQNNSFEEKEIKDKSKNKKVGEKNKEQKDKDKDQKKKRKSSGSSNRSNSDASSKSSLSDISERMRNNKKEKKKDKQLKPKSRKSFDNNIDDEFDFPQKENEQNKQINNKKDNEDNKEKKDKQEKSSDEKEKQSGDGMKEQKQESEKQIDKNKEQSHNKIVQQSHHQIEQQSNHQIENDDNKVIKLNKRDSKEEQKSHSNIETQGIKKLQSKEKIEENLAHTSLQNIDSPFMKRDSHDENKIIKNEDSQDIINKLKKTNSRENNGGQNQASEQIKIPVQVLAAPLKNQGETQKNDNSTQKQQQQTSQKSIFNMPNQPSNEEIQLPPKMPSVFEQKQQQDLNQNSDIKLQSDLKQQLDQDIQDTTKYSNHDLQGKSNEIIKPDKNVTSQNQSKQEQDEIKGIKPNSQSKLPQSQIPSLEQNKADELIHQNIAFQPLSKNEIKDNDFDFYKDSQREQKEEDKNQLILVDQHASVNKKDIVVENKQGSIGRHQVFQKKQENNGQGDDSKPLGNLDIEEIGHSLHQPNNKSQMDKPTTKKYDGFSDDTDSFDSNKIKNDKNTKKVGKVFDEIDDDDF